MEDRPTNDEIGGGISVRSEREHAAIIDELQRLDPSFEEIDNYYFGVTDSAKEVLFGTDDTGMVAVKPFTDLGVRDRAQHEASMMKIAENRGFLTFLNPRVVQGERANYLVTDYMPNVRAMNNVGWEKSVDSRMYQEELVPLLNRIGTFAGEMHGRGIAHGDFLLKNCVRKRDGSFLLMDLERTKICDDIDDEAKVSAFSEDMGKLMASLIRKQFLSTQNWEVIEEQLVTTLVEPYVDSLEQHGGSTEVGLEVCIQALDRAKLTHTLTSQQLIPPN